MSAGPSAACIPPSPPPTYAEKPCGQVRPQRQMKEWRCLQWALVTQESPRLKGRPRWWQGSSCPTSLSPHTARAPKHLEVRWHFLSHGTQALELVLLLSSHHPLLLPLPCSCPPPRSLMHLTQFLRHVYTLERHTVFCVCFQVGGRTHCFC